MSPLVDKSPKYRAPTVMGWFRLMTWSALMLVVTRAVSVVALGKVAVPAAQLPVAFQP